MSICNKRSEDLLGHLVSSEEAQQKQHRENKCKRHEPLKNISLLVKNLILLPFPQGLKLPHPHILLRHHQFPCLVKSSILPVIQRVFVLVTWLQKACFLKLNASLYPVLSSPSKMQGNLCRVVASSNNKTPLELQMLTPPKVQTSGLYSL